MGTRGGPVTDPLLEDSSASRVAATRGRQGRVFSLREGAWRLGHRGWSSAQGYPAPGAGAGNLTTCPVVSRRGSGPPQCWATTNSSGSGPLLSAHAKAPLSRSTVARISPPRRTRTQRLLPTSAYQTAPVASRQIPSG